MSAAQWAWLITTLLAILLGFITWKLDNDKKAIAGLAGLVAASLGASVALYFEVEGIRTEQAAVLGRAVPTLKSPIWNSVVRDIAEYDRQNSENPIEEALNEPLREIISRSIGQAREGYMEVPDKHEVVVVTLRLLDKANQSVRATSYIDPKEWWGSDIAQAYAEKLRETRQHVGVFERIFIVNSTEELRGLKPVMDAQERAGLVVKFVCASTVPPDKRKDFIIVDSTAAGELLLTEQRRFKNAVFYSTSVRAADFDRLFTYLWVGARPASDIGRVTCAAQ